MPAADEVAPSARRSSRRPGCPPPRSRGGPRASGPNELEPAAADLRPAARLEALTEPFVHPPHRRRASSPSLSARSATGCSSCSRSCPIVGADVVTEYRGERALDALREASAPTARVRRDGAVRETAAAGLVPATSCCCGPATSCRRTCVCCGRTACSVDRSALTGESVPGAGGHGAGPIRTRRWPSRHAMAYGGTSVVGGRGEGVVVAIGPATEVGRIAQGLGSVERHRSPLQRELDRLVRILLVVAIGLIAIVTGLGFARGQDAGANLSAGISAAIAAIPEEPPILLAVILGLGAYRLLRRTSSCGGSTRRRRSARST